ncbi:hypothetical protein G3T14_05420 [Methylobacterium sp. BTF04]|uniref:hypothetical protein n=1 Tax=Methylobacterium sp. BTF04 TaxID=2708300 RepID=UPI0013D138AE|nr:hypothetical protein [Methylobacterium sp. BTF04]NEU11566.1 hypothetical protein [Methylobacterium sp. BTF04]
MTVYVSDANTNRIVQTLQIHDFLPSKDVVVDPHAVLTMLGERAIRSSWQVAGVARYDEAVMVVGDEAADRLKALSKSRARVSGIRLTELFDQTVQIIWGEFTAFEVGEVAPWVVIRAIDSSWCEVETNDEEVLDRVRQDFEDVRTDS